MKERPIDITDLNIPNVCFYLTEKDDEMEEQFRKKSWKENLMIVKHGV